MKLSDKEQAWLDFFENIEVFKESQTTKEELVEAFSKPLRSFHSKEFKECLEISNFTITELPEKIDNLWVVLFAYSPFPYSIEKTKEIILENMEKLSDKYDNTIPLVYTTLPLPHPYYFTAEIWREIKGVESFKKEEHGHLEFTRAIYNLWKEAVISILFFEILAVSDKSVTFRVVVQKNNKSKKKVKEKGPKLTKPLFIEEDGEIKFNGKTCKLPLNTNQYFLCKILFCETSKTRVTEQEILDSVDWDRDNKRSVYDAMRAVNLKTKKHLNVDQFLKWMNGSVWINQDM